MTENNQDNDDRDGLDFQSGNWRLHISSWALLCFVIIASVIGIIILGR